MYEYKKMRAEIGSHSYNYILNYVFLGVTFCLSKATEARQKCDKLNRAVSESYARYACNLLI